MNYDKTSILHRLKIISGQMQGLAKMIEEKQYCVDLLIQSLAIQKALKKIDGLILENHLSTCVIDQIKEGRQKKAIKELLAIYSLSKKG